VSGDEKGASGPLPARGDDRGGWPSRCGQCDTGVRPPATIPADRTLYQRQIEATNRQIDALVYKLYGLTEEEIAIVEGR